MPADQTVLTYPLSGLITGIIFQRYFSLAQTTAIISTIATAITVGLFLFFFKKWLVIAIAIFFCALGTLVLSTQTTNYKKKQRLLPSQSTSLTGYILDKKENEWNHSSGIIPPLACRQSFYKETLSLQTNETKPYTITCYLKKLTALEPGDLITLTNIRLLTPKQKPTITGNPPFSDYLIKESIIATTFIKEFKRKDWAIRYPTKKFIRSWFLKKRHRLYTALKKKIPPKTFGYFSAIFLGNKQGAEYTPDRNIFHYWGTSHHLARSGLHIALFILIWTILLSLLPLPYIAKNIILTSICSIYTLLSWTSTSFTRAISLFTLYQIGILLNKQTDLLYFLQLVALSVLIFNPMQLFFLDFQLSFGITAALIWVFSSKKGTLT